ncbi:heme-binding protein [Mycobacterium sp. E1747]|uniref:heme-binding protein n=1 Tax=Mycobacterium sp. E1747 TaxID=1834128 RepID=UPI0007FEF679|nr:hypothetical protein A5695_16570 [Mycobacterium sp. E1747]
MATLPAPSDDQVRLVTVPPTTMAVLPFSGDRSPKVVASRTQELLNMLRAKGIKPTGEEAWFYDPPSTLPMRRRNEIAVPIDPPPR